MDLQTFLLVALAALTAGMIGANNASNATATVVGAKVTTHSGALAIFSIGLAAGAVLEGGKLSGAVQGMAIGGEIGAWSVEVILGVTLGMIIIATAMGFPLPVTQAIFGAALGSGIFLGLPLNFGGIAVVLVSWAATPLVAAAAALVISKTEKGIPVRGIRTGTMLYGIMTICTSFYTAYVLGANTIGLVVGVMKGGLGWEGSLLIAVISAVAGGVLFGRRVSTTVGERIASMGPPTAFACQMGSALTVHLFTQGGIPVSISQAVIGGVAGGAFSKGMKALNASAGARIAALWAATPIITAFLAWLVHASALG